MGGIGLEWKKGDTPMNCFDGLICGLISFLDVMKCMR